MTLSCRFISAFQLEPEHLSFLIHPEKVGWLLRSYKNPEQIQRLLPEFLQQRLSAYVKRGQTLYLSHLQEELRTGNWAVLSLSRQSKPVTADQLNICPTLKRRVAELQTKSLTYRKAHYSPVSDMTPLARNLSYTPIEPLPEHKIVVEFSGQWGGNACSLSLGETDQQSEKITKPKADLLNPHRSFASFKALENEPKNLYLSIPLTTQPTPLNLLLAENISPVEKDTEMDEWETVLVPVVPFYTPADDPSDSASARHMEGYLYVIWQDKIWREIEINDLGYYSDIDINYYRDQTPESAVLTRHADIFIVNKETGSRFSFEPFQVKQKGEVVSEGILNGTGEARIFNLTEPEVEVVMTDYEPPKIFTVETLESPFKGSKEIPREATGRPMPHIWLPYKVVGEAQTLYMYHSSDQLSATELSKLESEAADMATELAGFDKYSSEQTFTIDDGAVRALALPDAAATQPREYAVVSKQLDQNVASVFINKPPVSLTFLYPGYSPLDESDDYFELKETEGEWLQRVYLRECGITDDGQRKIRFSGWPPEVEKLDLVRGYLGQQRYKRDNQTVIFREAPVAGLLAAQDGQLS